MKLSCLVLIVGSLAACAETEEQINKRFAVQPGGKLVVEVDFGSIDVSTNATSEVVVDVLRKVSRRNKSDEEAFLREHPVTFSQDGDAVTIRSRRQKNGGDSWRGSQRTEGKYTITVPARFNAQLKTAGGGVAVNDLTGEVNAGTSGGGLTFARLRGPLDGDTSGGGIRVADCEGALKVRTSGGGIEVSGGSGTLEGSTSGGSVVVKNFHGPAQVGTSGGDINVENIAGKIAGSTSGGSISAVLESPLPGDVKLSSSGGGLTVRVPENAAFDLDAATSAGGVSSELPVTVVGKISRDHMKGAVNGGGKSIVLRTSGGSIRVKKL